MRTWIVSLVSFTGLVTACGDDGGNTPSPDGPTGGGDGQQLVDAPMGCARQPAAADRTRFVVIARPYASGGGQSPMYEVLELSAAGSLTRFQPPRVFSLGARTPFGTIAFTPDGEVGLVPMDNGNLGVFKLDASGMPSVVQANYQGAFYADRVVMDPAGDRAWIVDANTRENGGGIYLVTIDCDGTVADRGLVAAARSPGGMGFTSSGRAVVAARDILGSPTTGHEVHVLDWSNPPTLLGGGDAFGDDDQIMSGFALSRDGTKVFVGDSNVSGTNRVAVASVTASGATSLAVLNGITDPSSIATSPHGDVALVSASQPGGTYAEGIYILDAGGANGAWRVRGEVTYAGGAAVLPGDMTTIDRGQLAGSVLVAELSRVRRLMFRDNGNVDDVSSLTFGSGLENIVGAIGVTP